MRIVTWNVRGINALNKRHHIKSQIENCGVDIVLIQETKLSDSKEEQLFKKWHWNYTASQAIGVFGGLAILWKLNVDNISVIATKANIIIIFV